MGNVCNIALESIGPFNHNTHFTHCRRHDIPFVFYNYTNKSKMDALGQLQKKPSLESLKRAAFDDHKIPLEDLLQRYQTSLTDGLTTTEALKKLQENGFNQLTFTKKPSEVIRFLKTIFQGFSILMWIGAVLCFFVFLVSVYTRPQYDYDNLWLGVTLVIVVLLTGFFSYYQEGKSSKVMRTFQQMVPQHANVIRDAKVDTIPSEYIVRGDLVILKSGDRIPADIRITDSSEFKVDNSCLTGESEPQTRTNKYTHVNPLETKNMAMFSTYAVEGTAKGIVVRTGDATIMGNIAGITSTIQQDVTPIGREIRIFMHLIATWACFLGFVFFFLSLSMGSSWIEAIVFLIGIIVANVPEGLIATVTLCLTLTSKRLAARNCLVKKLEAVETLGSTSIICSDKTGTLTQNMMTVSHMWFDGRIIEVFEGGQVWMKDVESGTYTQVCKCAILCNRAEFKPNSERISAMRREVIGDASEAAILKCMEIATDGFVNEFRERHPKVFEIPFNSTDKFQMSIHEWKDSSYLLVMKGAPERIIDKCTTFLKNGEEIQLTSDIQARIQQACTDLASFGERVLGLCDLTLTGFPKNHIFHQEDGDFPTAGFRFLGLVSLVDPPRPAVPDAIDKCRQAGIKVIMVTGDHPLTATSIARQVGIITDYRALTDTSSRSQQAVVRDTEKQASAVVIVGSQLDSMNDEELDEVIKQYDEIVFARTSPTHKLKIVESCQRTGAVVAVTGDGVNDAPALKKADIGIAMGISGSDVCKAAADMVLLNDDFSSIVVSVEEGRRIFDNLKKCIAYTLASNVPEITPFLVYVAVGTPLPLGVIGVLCIDLGTDLWPAIALAYEKAESHIMRRQPRDASKDHLVNHRLLFLAYAQIGVIEAAAGFFTYFIVMAQNGFLPGTLIGLRNKWDNEMINDLADSFGQEWTYKSRKVLEHTCHTAFFVSIVIGQIANVIVCKTRYNSIVTQGMNNWCLNSGIVFEVALAAFLAYTPTMTYVFRTYPLHLVWWTPAIPFAIIILIYDEVRKLIIRRRPGGWIYRETYY